MRFSFGGQIREFKNFAKIINLIALLKKNENSRTLNFMESQKIRNLRKFKHRQFIRSTVAYIIISTETSFAPDPARHSSDIITAAGDSNTVTDKVSVTVSVTDSVIECKVFCY